MQPNFSRQERSLLAVLADGKRHQKSELLDAMEDELADSNSLTSALNRLRTKLATIGQGIIVEFSAASKGKKPFWYRQVRFLSTDDT